MDLNHIIVIDFFGCHLPLLLNISNTGKVVVTLLNGGEQRLNPQHRLAICQPSGGSGTNIGCIRLAGIGVHCAGT